MSIRNIAILLFSAVLPLLSIGQQANAIKLFFEKSYVQSDKASYVAGEDIWFKAYLVNAQTKVRINTSNVLYVELISPIGKVLDRETINLQNGLGEGDFALPANAATGNYRIRAYTNWMQNFGDLFMFEKIIQVAAEPTVKKTFPERYVPTFVRENMPPNLPGSNHILFFAEGGNMVLGVQSQLAFKAVDSYGIGISIKGKIINSNGDSITTFTTSHAGMGSFVFAPQAGLVYKAVGKYANREMFEVELPSALPIGYVMGISDEDNKIKIKLQADATTANKLSGKLMVIIKSIGKKAFTDSSIILVNQQAMVTIAKSSLPQGINIVTLYDEKRRPTCERLFYVDNGPAVNFKITTDKPSYDSREKATANILVTNAQGEPVQARLSMAVTNAIIVPSSNSSIVSYLNLESEIRGVIENSVQYFDITNTKRLPQLDLLLQTQGWRQFLWRRLLDTTIVIKYMPEPGITLSGKVEKLLSKKGLPDMNITLYAEKSKGDKLLLTTTNADGRYFMDGLPLYGQQDVRLSARNSKSLKREGKILLDSLYGKPYPVSKASDLIFDTSAVTHNFWQQAAKLKKTMLDEDIKDKGELQNVTVIGQQKTIRLTEDVGMRFGADSLFVIKTADGEYKTLENFILQRYPGAFTNADQDGFFFYGDGGARLRPRWVVDGREDRFGTGNSMDVDEETGRNDGAYDRVDYFNIPINKVKTVAVTPIINQSGKQIMVIHLTLLPGALDVPDFTIVNATINGYYEARKYYEPTFVSNTGNVKKSDLRTTIFWAPMLQTDADGKVSVTFTNSTSKSVEVCVEGITDGGIPVAATLKYSVK